MNSKFQTMQHLRIGNPCNENWNAMTPTEKGAFCGSCQKQVIDFTGQSPSNIKAVILENSCSEICGRIEQRQLDGLNNEYEAWRNTENWSIQRATFYAFLFVFGISLVSCSEQEDASRIVELQKKAMEVVNKDDQRGKQIVQVSESINTTQHQLLLGRELQKDAEIIEYLVERDEAIPVEIREEISVTMGIMISSPRYMEYLEQATTDPLIEPQRDANGLLIPSDFYGKVFPNPGNGVSTIQLELPKDITLTMSIFNLGGDLVQSIGTLQFKAGTHQLPVDISNQLPGTYFITVLSEDFNETLRLIKI